MTCAPREVANAERTPRSTHAVQDIERSINGLDSPGCALTGVPGRHARHSTHVEAPRPPVSPMSHMQPGASHFSNTVCSSQTPFRHEVGSAYVRVNDDT